MPDFEFAGSVTTIFDSGTYAGALAPGGIGFTFVFNSPFDVVSLSADGNDIFFAQYTATGFGGGAQASYSAAFAFTDTALFFSDFQLNGTGFAVRVETTLGATTTIGAGVNFTGNVMSFVVVGNSAIIDTLDSITTTSIQCFCAGTEITTVLGPKRIEDLQPGDLLVLADGGTTEVRWLGRQEINGQVSQSEWVDPVCVSAGTLGNAQDLWVSPEHGIVIDGLLINASALVNGTTITRGIGRALEDGFTYYHVETEAHEVILAEGVPVESYLDTVSLGAFSNAAERPLDKPMTEMVLPRVTTRHMVPKHISEALGRTAKAVA